MSEVRVSYNFPILFKIKAAIASGLYSMENCDGWWLLFANKKDKRKKDKKKRKKEETIDIIDQFSVWIIEQKYRERKIEVWKGGFNLEGKMKWSVQVRSGLWQKNGKEI